MIYESAELASVSVKMGDKTAFSMQNLTAEITPMAEGKPMEFTAAAEKFTADLFLGRGSAGQGGYRSAGLSESVGHRCRCAGTWQPTDGRMNISKYDISVDNAGTFGMTFDLGGYTPALHQVDAGDAGKDGHASRTVPTIRRKASPCSA